MAKIIHCDECTDIVYNSTDEKRFKAYQEIDGLIWCGDCFDEGNPPDSNNIPLRVSNNNSDRVILDLCGGTGAWSEPYKSNNYDVRVIDPQEWLSKNKGTGDARLMEYINEPIYGILCAPPCTHLAGSGARWWEQKGEKALLDGLSVVDACLRIITMHKPKFWALENPVGRLRKYLGDPTLIFQPYEFGDPWMKKTLLWGDFNIPDRNPVNPEYSLTERFRSPRDRSKTPPNFAKAFFNANK